jgi:hypothetical protein
VRGRPLHGQTTPYLRARPASCRTAASVAPQPSVRMPSRTRPARRFQCAAQGPASGGGGRPASDCRPHTRIMVRRGHRVHRPVPASQQAARWGGAMCADVQAGVRSRTAGAAGLHEAQDHRERGRQRLARVLSDAEALAAARAPGDVLEVVLCDPVLGRPAQQVVFLVGVEEVAGRVGVDARRAAQRAGAGGPRGRQWAAAGAQVGTWNAAPQTRGFRPPRRPAVEGGRRMGWPLSIQGLARSRPLTGVTAPNMLRGSTKNATHPVRASQAWGSRSVVSDCAETGARKEHRI